MAGRALVREYNELAAERILDVAARLFVEHGVARVGMADVAKAAGCSRATLYRYFDSREALRIAYIHREARRLERDLAAALLETGSRAQKRVAGKRQGTLYLS